MRVPSHWCSLALLACAGPLLGQSISDNPSPTFISITSSSHDPRFSLTAAITRPISQVTAFVFANLSISLRPTFSNPVFVSDAHLIGETSLSWQFAASRLPGQLRLGTWADTADIPTFPDGSRASPRGPYLVLDQMLWRANPFDDHPPRGLGLFFIYDHANTDLFPTLEHLSAGLSFRGVLPSRAHDILGIGLSYAYRTTDPAANDIRDSETAVEAFYKFQLAPHLSLRPDVQYILDPATTNSPDTLVASVRLELDY